jgi:ATP-dependent protease ClpP protease subunit
VDAATLGAVGTIVVGLAAAAAALIGHRGANAASQAGVVISGSLGLVDQVQEERDKVRAQLAENEVRLAAAYAELASERADKAALQGQITALTSENRQLRDRIVELGGQPT